MSAPPNQHAAQSRNILTSTFDGVFMNPLTNEEEIYTFGTSTTGYPPEFRRRVDLTVTEPNIIVTKEVCNETDFGIGPSCSNFLPLVDDGDAFDTYIFRVTVTNEAAANGVPRAPAYDVTVFSDMDPSDWSTSIRSKPTASTTTATARSTRPAAKADRSRQRTKSSGNPAQIITAYDHSDALLRIDAGDSVTFYYRVDPDNRVAPQQQLVETAYATYDSLEGDSGNQTDPLARTARSAARASTRRRRRRRRSRSSRSRCSRRPSCGCRIRRDRAGDAAAGIDRRGGRVRAAHADPGRALRHFD